MCEAGATPDVGYMNESDGATPICHVAHFRGLALTIVALY